MGASPERLSLTRAPAPARPGVVEVSGLSKVYAGGFKALQDVNLSIRRGEILALLGPNGAGKTTLIGIICGIVKPTSGRIIVDGHDIDRHARATRSMIGLVPQELTIDAFETVWATLRLSRGLFGKRHDPAHLQSVLKALSLWDRRNSRLVTLSGGMKRRVMIAKALSHEPKILFLDEPTAGVDVELRQDMWRTVQGLRESGVTIILTTHYIEEAEQLADRIGIINHGRLLLVEDKQALMRKLGKKELRLHLQRPLEAIPAQLARYRLSLGPEGCELIYHYDTQIEGAGPAARGDHIAGLLADVSRAGVQVSDLQTSESSLEQIFVDLVRPAR